MTPIISLLILIALFVLVCIVAKWLVGYMGIPRPIDIVLLVIVVLVGLYVLLHNVPAGIIK